MVKNLNILYHFRVRGIGAEGVHIAGIANGFQALGHEVAFVSPTDTDPISNINKKFLYNASQKTKVLHFLADHAPQVCFECIELLYNVIGISKLKNQIHKTEFGFIYERYAFYNIAGALMSKKYNIPLIVEVNELSGHERVRGQIMVPLAKKIEKLIFNQATLILVVSDFLKEHIAKMINSDRKILVIPNGVSREWVETEIPQSEIKGLQERLNITGKKVIGFVGGLDHWHSFDFLLELIGELKRNFSDIVLLIVGDGPLREYILSTADKLGLHDSIIITGIVPHEEVPKYISLFDIAIIPHSNEFRSPIKLFEYMAAGKAVVAPATIPIKSVIKDRINGAIFKLGIKEDALETINNLFINNQLREDIGKNAKNTIRDNYLWEKHSLNIVNELRRIALEDFEYPTPEV